MDFVSGVKGIEVLGLVKIPQHGSSVFSARSAKGSIRGDSDSVNVAGVTAVIGLDTTGRELPNLRR